MFVIITPSYCDHEVVMFGRIVTVIAISGENNKDREPVVLILGVSPNVCHSGHRS